MERMLLSIFLALTAGPVLAQQPPRAKPPGMVNVSLGHLQSAERTFMAKQLDVDVTQLPESVQAPVAIAAEVCSIPAAQLAKQVGDDPASCDARKPSQGLANLMKNRGAASRAGGETNPRAPTGGPPSPTTDASPGTPPLSNAAPARVGTSRPQTGVASGSSGGGTPASRASG